MTEKEKEKEKEKKEKYSCGTDDITFCMSSLYNKCDNIRCFRHMNNILCPNIPHSFAELKHTEYCPSIISNEDEDEDEDKKGIDVLD